MVRFNPWVLLLQLLNSSRGRRLQYSSPVIGLGIGRGPGMRVVDSVCLVRARRMNHPGTQPRPDRYSRLAKTSAIATHSAIVSIYTSDALCAGSNWQPRPQHGDPPLLDVAMSMPCSYGKSGDHSILLAAWRSSIAACVAPGDKVIHPVGLRAVMPNNCMWIAPPGNAYKAP
jgi:hypothetical protein